MRKLEQTSIIVRITEDEDRNYNIILDHINRLDIFFDPDPFIWKTLVLHGKKNSYLYK